MYNWILPAVHSLEREMYFANLTSSPVKKKSDTLLRTKSSVKETSQIYYNVKNINCIKICVALELFAMFNCSVKTKITRQHNGYSIRYFFVYHIHFVRFSDVRTNRLRLESGYMRQGHWTCEKHCTLMFCHWIFYWLSSRNTIL